MSLSDKILCICGNSLKGCKGSPKELRTIECCYYMGWDGYGLAQEIMRKLKFKPVKFISMDLTCNSNWLDELKQETYKETNGKE